MASGAVRLHQQVNFLSEFQFNVFVFTCSVFICSRVKRRCCESVQTSLETCFVEKSLNNFNFKTKHKSGIKIFVKSFLFSEFVSVLQLSISVNTSDRQCQMAAVLEEAFNVVNDELKTALQGGRDNSAPCGVLEDDKMLSLLEKYSEQLVQMTQNKLNVI